MHNFFIPNIIYTLYLTPTHLIILLFNYAPKIIILIKNIHLQLLQ